MKNEKFCCHSRMLQSGIQKFALFIFFWLLFTGYWSLVFAGSLDPSALPSPTGKTLSDIYNRASSGTAAGTHTLAPSSAPGPTMYTLTQIYNALPGGTTTNAGASDVSSEKTFITRANGVLTFTTGTWSIHELPDTGQTTVYTAGDDASNQPAASQPSYSMYTDATMATTAPVGSALVTVDNRTGLMWATDGTLTLPGAQPMTWAAAFTWISALNLANYAGKNDWRLPNVKELMSIVNSQAYSPAINTSYFRNTQSSYYWTSTTYADITLAWVVNSTGGFMDYRNKTSTTNYVRPVRGGPE